MKFLLKVISGATCTCLQSVFYQPHKCDDDNMASLLKNHRGS